MTQKGWSLNGLQRPPAVHLAITQRQAQPGLAEKFVEDLRESVETVKAHPELQGSMGPVYGLAGNIEYKGAVEEILKGILDLAYSL
jgi:hypothetical protein